MRPGKLAAILAIACLFHPWSKSWLHCWSGTGSLPESVSKKISVPTEQTSTSGTASGASSCIQLLKISPCELAYMAWLESTVFNEWFESCWVNQQDRWLMLEDMGMWKGREKYPELCIQCIRPACWEDQHGVLCKTLGPKLVECQERLVLFVAVVHL